MPDGLNSSLFTRELKAAIGLGIKQEYWQKLLAPGLGSMNMYPGKVLSEPEYRQYMQGYNGYQSFQEHENYENLQGLQNQQGKQDYLKQEYLSKYQKDFQGILQNVYNNDKPQLTIKKMPKITGKEYLIVTDSSVVDIAKTPEDAIKSASDVAYKTQGSVFIFRPFKEIAPKRDVEVTDISLDK
jgi:hypothetical protein